jgi:DNA-binding transcriptional LysR family regulator
MIVMHPDYVLGIDLNLLKVFSAIYRERHLTRAGERIGLTQPAMSQALRRLRSHFSDELFVRSNGTMVPTVLADELIGPVNRALNLISGALSGQRGFDPGVAERTFRIGTNEFVSIYMMPTIMRIVRRAAPGIILQAINLPSWQAPSRSAMSLSSQTFIDNRLDLIVLPYIRHNDEVRSTELYSEPSIVLASSDNPHLGDKVSIDQYVAADHVATSTFGANRTYLDDILAAMGLKRRVVLWTPHVFASIEAVVACNLICSIPTTIALAAAEQRPGLRTSPLPFEAPHRPIFSYWMADRASDPALGWLRSVFDGAARDLAARSPQGREAAA